MRRGSRHTSVAGRGQGKDQAGTTKQAASPAVKIKRASPWLSAPQKQDKQQQAEALSAPSCARRSLFEGGNGKSALAGGSRGGGGVSPPTPSLFVEATSPLMDLPPADITEEVHLSTVEGQEEEEAVVLQDVGAEEEEVQQAEALSPVSSHPSSAVTPVSVATPESSGGQLVSPRKRKTSVVWDHFEVGVDPRFAVCHHCKLTLSRGSASGHYGTSSMKMHLQRQHQSILLGKKAGTSQATASRGKQKATAAAGVGTATLSSPSPIPTRGRQATLEDMGWGKYGTTRWRFPTPTQITTCIGEMVALDDQPFSLVDNAGFKRLMALVVPYYKLPCRTTLSRRVVPSLYRSCRELVLARLCQAEGRTVHFTSDIWSSEGGVHAYLSLTAHWWAGAGQEASSTMGTGKEGYCWALLHTQVMDQSHTAAEVTEAMNRMVDGWLAGQQLTRGYMVTDGGANMVKAVRDGGFEGVRCIAHVLNLVVRDGLGMGSKANLGPLCGIRNLLESCRKVAGHFHHSVKGSRLLREKQEELNLPQHRLVQDVVTRWNSTYLMLERMVEQQRAIHDLFRVRDMGVHPALGKQQWDAMSQLVVVLKPFLEATETLSTSSALLSQVIPVGRHLQKQMGEFLEYRDPVTGRRFEPEVREAVTRLRDGLTRRLEPIQTDRVYMLAGMCDPRVKDGLCGPNTRQHWVEMLVGEVRAARAKRVGQSEAEEQATTPRSSSSSSSSLTCIPPSRSTGQGFWAQALHGVVGQRPSPATGQDDAATAVQRYLAEPMEECSTDPLAYWSSRRQIWPDLARVASDRLSCPPTSVPSERVFSMAGDIVTPHRSRLEPDLVEQLVFLKGNLPLLGYPTLKPSWE